MHVGPYARWCLIHKSGDVWNWAKYPSVGEQLKKVWHVYTIEYYLTIEKISNDLIWKILGIENKYRKTSIIYKNNKVDFAEIERNDATRGWP